MIDLDLRRRLRSQEPVVGMFNLIDSADAVEIMGRSGFDVVVIDLEHTGRDWTELRHAIRAAEASGTVPLVRTSGIDESQILRVLELGAAGIVVPFLETVEQVEDLARITRYAPTGARGTCTVTRAASYGLRRAEFGQLADASNRGVIVLGQIESLAGVENVSAMLDASDVLDGLIVGRSDLAADLGHPGQVEHPDVVEAVDRLTKEVADRGSACLGIVTYSGGEARAWVDKGYSLLFYAADTVALANFCRATAAELRDVATAAPTPA